jgi:hypothetical protein
MATLYLMAQRKAWHHDEPKGWKEVAFERFDYVECGIFEKPDADLTDEDRQWIEWYGERPDGWIEPATPGERWIDRATALLNPQGGH